MPLACTDCTYHTEYFTPQLPKSFPNAGSTPAHRQAQRSRLEEVEDQIHRLQAQIYTLQGERSALKEHLDAITYPILTIPNKIASEIFIQYLPDSGRVRPSKQIAPLLLTRVCRRFRQISLSTLGLWSSIFLDTREGSGWPADSDRFALGKGVAKLVKKWLSRNSHIISALTKFTFKWHRLEVELLPSDMASLEKVRDSCPNLRELAIISPLTSTLDFRNAPALSEVRILGATPVQRAKLDMEALTSLQIDKSLAFLDFRNILTTCLRLIRLDVCDVDEAKGDDDQTMFPAHSLQFLSLGRDVYPLNFLVLPDLQHLQVPLEDMETLLDFLDQSTFRLSHLHFSRIYI
ncbi:hypothetical protein C8R43DRAFT_1192939 [Mycena crocata]|nr:hypothetical protein C8R43DRAFT_1192939 [Mycena crocata]